MADEQRIGDSDRDRAVDRLTTAFAEGRLDDSEYEERLKIATRATVDRELADLFTDLAESSSPVESAPAVEHIPETATVSQPGILDQLRQSEAAPLIGGAVTCTVIWAFTNFGGYFWPMWVWFGVIVFAVQRFFAGQDESDS